MKKQIYIHIGCHKTGSTALQSHLSAYSYLLRAYGLVYPRLSPNSGGRNQDLVIDIKTRRTDKNRPKLLQSYIKFIDESNCERFFLSAESFYWRKQAVEYFTDLQKKYSVKIVFFIRRQDMFLESMYKQKIKNGSMFKFQDYAAEKKADWLRMSEMWLARFRQEDLIVIPTREDGSFDSIETIAYLLNLPIIRKLPRLKIHNRSLSCETIEFIRHLRQMDIRFDRSKLYKFDRSLDRRSTAYYSFDERVDFINKFEAKNNQLADMFGLKKPLFGKLDMDRERKIEPFSSDLFDAGKYMELGKRIKLIL